MIYAQVRNDYELPFIGELDIINFTLYPDDLKFKAEIKNYNFEVKNALEINDKDLNRQGWRYYINGNIDNQGNIETDGIVYKRTDLQIQVTDYYKERNKILTEMEEEKIIKRIIELRQKRETLREFGIHTPEKITKIDDELAQLQNKLKK